jgi:hypothetical protein
MALKKPTINYRNRKLKYRYILIVLGTIIIASSAYSQRNPIFPVKELAEKYPDEPVVKYSSETTYSFDLSNSQYMIVVKQNRSDQFVSLKPNSRAVTTTFYDRYSEIARHNVRGTGIHKAATHQFCGSFERDGIFYHDAKVCRYYLAFNNTGDYLTHRTTKEFNNPLYFGRIPLHSNFAVHQGKVIIEIPATVEIELYEMNFGSFDITRTENTIKTNRIIEYQFNNIPSGRNAINLPDYSCAFPHILVSIKGYWRSGEWNKVLESQDDLYDWYIRLMPEYEISSELAVFTDALTEGAQSDRDKILAVYSWIHDKIRYFAFADGAAAYVPEDPNKVFSNKYGDCKGMAILAKTMLKHIGMDARLAWVYSGNYCYDRSINSVLIDNHMICVVKLNGENIFIDPTANYSPLHEIPESIQGRSCVIENDDGWEIENIPAQDHTNNLYRVENIIELNNNNFRIEGKILLRGHTRQIIQTGLNRIATTDKQELLRYFITRANTSFRTDSITLSSTELLNDSFELDYTLTIANAAVSAGNKILLNLDYYDDLQRRKIELPREFPYDIGFRRQHELDLILKIPEGYQIDYLPDAFNVSHPKFSFSGFYKSGDNQIVYTRKLSIKDSLLYPADFPEWNDAIEKLQRFYKEMVILQKP